MNQRVVTGCATPGAAASLTLGFRLALGITILLAGCGSAPPKFLDKPRPVEVKVPGPVQAVDPTLMADCAPAPLANTALEGLLGRLGSVEDCLKQLRDQAGKLRALQPPSP